MFAMLRLSSAALVLAVTAACPCSGQQVYLETPKHQINEGFFENMGMSWGVGGKDWFANVGNSPISAAPSFGGFDPQAGLNFGWASRWGGTTGQFNFNFSQGNRRTFVSETPSVMLQNGIGGSIQDNSITPFVMGYVPVVGGYSPHGVPIPQGGYSVPGYYPSAPFSPHGNPMMPPRQGPLMQPNQVGVPHQAAMANRAVAALPPRAVRPPLRKGPGPGFAANPKKSSAAAAAMSVQAAKRLREADQTAGNKQAIGYVERAKTARQSGKPNVAKAYLQMALRNASGALKQEIQAELGDVEAELDGR